MKNMKNKIHTCAAAILAGSAACSAGSDSSPRPNLLIVMCDDMRIGMMSSAGHPYIKTPNLDRFSREGVRFNNAYALSPICGPSRASIFTGQYSSMHMRRDNLFYPETYEYYLPQYFKDAGYKTALIGKYYEGGPFGATARKAYDRWFTWKGNVEPAPTGKKAVAEWERGLYVDAQYEEGSQKKQIKGHMTDILFDEASRFVTEQKDRPFCVFLSPFAPHMPYIMTERNKGRYKGMGLPPRENQEVDQGYFKDPGHRKMLPEWYEQYCEMIADVDDGMGQLLGALEKNGQLDNTLIILTSDNGLMFAEHGFAWKRHPWEESAKVPFYVRYPRLAKPGTQSDALVCLADIFFTCAEVGGVKLPEIPGQAGRSIVPVLTGTQAQVRDQLLLMEYEQLYKLNDHLPTVMQWAGLVRADGWKLARYNVPPEQRPETDMNLMFRLSNDKFEKNNLAENPECLPVFREMKTQLETRLKEVNATLFSGPDAVK
jgi:arylsulfatase A-like enzyme